MRTWILWNLGTSDYDKDLSSIPGYRVFNIMDLEDGWNDPEQIAGRLLQIIDIVNEKKNLVIIMCAAGISRSNAIAMGVLCINNNMEWDDAYRIVKRMVPQADPNGGIIDAVKQAINIIKSH